MLAFPWKGHIREEERKGRAGFFNGWLELELHSIVYTERVLLFKNVPGLGIPSLYRHKDLSSTHHV